METTNRFALMIEALTELSEEENAPATSRAKNLPALESVVADLSPLPSDALFLGVADDGLPILLNLYDPAPGAILIAGDSGSGKTNLLKVIARAAEILHDPSQVQYGVITESLDEWERPKDSRHSVGVYNTSDASASELLSSLVEWAHANKGETQCFLLLIDDLNKLTELDEQTQQNLRWLLMRGANRRVWVFTTLRASRASELGAWLDFFRTRLFGFIEEREEAEAVAGDADKAFNILLKSSEFTMPEDNRWLNFWIPKIGK